MGDSNIVQRFIGSFEWHSSPLDWCEPNYAVTSSIAEFYNTITNLAFVLPPCLFLYLFHPFARAHSSRVQIVWLLNIVIGVCSAYFHSTLSLAGQLLDEFGILWMLGSCIAFWMPLRIPRLIPGRIFKNIERNSFEKGMLMGTFALTVMGCFWPFVNSFFLLILTVPVAAIVVSDVLKCRDPLARGVAYRSLVFWMVAVTVWLSDRFACGLWRTVSLPGGHWLWHLLSAVSAYHAVVYVIYQDAVTTVTNSRPVMRLWPSGDWKLLGVAYVALEPRCSSEMEKMNGNVGLERCKNC